MDAASVTVAPPDIAATYAAIIAFFRKSVQAHRYDLLIPRQIKVIITAYTERKAHK